MMLDGEKVIKGLENLRETIRNATQYTFTSGGICAMNMKRIDNAIELLKEQEHKDRMYHALEDDWKRLKELLKEQEAVLPIPYHRSDGTIFKYECRKCRTKIFKGDLFCRHCGNPVLWEGR